MTEQERFWAKVNKDGECWLWTGAVSKIGKYGVCKRNRKFVSTHRLAWEYTHGPIPSGLLVCHHCDVRLCVRPDHLFLGTHTDNMRDCAAKGRLPKAKLSVKQAEEIRNRYIPNVFGFKRLAKEYGVCTKSIQGIIKGICYKKVS